MKRLILWLFAICACRQMALAQPIVDCSCLATQSVLITNACQAVIPDLCQFTNCFISTAVPPLPFTCSQTPPAGGSVGPGSYSIAVTVSVPGLAPQTCPLTFTVNQPSTGCGFSLNCASNKTVECGTAWIFDPPTPTNQCPDASGLPGTVTTNIISLVTNGTCPMVITVTWMAIDDCGIAAVCQQVVTVSDTTPPSIKCPPDITLECTVPPTTNKTGVATAGDTCSGVTNLSFVDAFGTTNCTGLGTILRTWTAIDGCGNIASCLQNISFKDTVPPSIKCPPDITLECSVPATTNKTGVATAGDTCSGVTNISFADAFGATNCSGQAIILRTWTATDGCGNSSTCLQTISFQDTTPPVLDCTCLTNAAINPFPLTVVACTTNLPDFCPIALACATDNCGTLTCAQAQPAGTVVGPGTYPITVTVSDCSGNSASCVVIFTVLAPPGGCNPCLPPPPGMVAWWPLDELTGASLFVDATGNGHTAIVESGGPVGNPFSPSAVPGEVAGANYFYGLSPRGRALNVPSLNFNTNSFSIDCWVNPVLTGPTFFHPIVDKFNQTGPGVGFGYMAGVLNTKFVLRVGSGPINVYTSVGSVSYAAWNFVAVAVDRVANTVTFNVNGVTEPAQSLIPAGSFNSTVDLLIGSTYNTNIGLGELAVDELELFDRTITASEMNSLWLADSLGKCKTNTCIVSIFCPTNIVTTRSCTQTCVNVSYPLPLFTNGILSDCTPPSGTCFPLGATVVTCTATNNCGQTAQCTFSITVDASTNCIPCDYTLAQRLDSGTAGGSLLPTGATELLWVNTAAPGGPIPMVVVDTNVWPINPGPWLAPSAQSAWVSPSVSSYGPVGNYTNRWTFDAPCTNVCLRGRFAADDAGYLYVNGTLVAGPAGYAPWTTVNACTGFSNGPNTIELVVTNAFGPTGFRTELEIWTQCCTNCVSQTNVWNTGMDGASGNVPLAAGTPDPNYTLVSQPPGGCTGPAQVLLPSSLPVPPWISNGPNSQWIGAGLGADCQGGVYHYRLCFYLPCATGASIVGQWTADDWAGMYLNGLPTGNTVPSIQFPNVSFAGWHPVNITNGFVCGNNCLDFYVTNAWTFDNPTGLRAELTNIYNNCCCGPAQTVFSFFSGEGPGGALGLGAPDPQFSLTCSPPGVAVTTPVVVQPNPFWLPNDANSQWIGPDPSNNGPGGLYCYTLNFNLPPCPSGNPTYAVTGRWMGDDAGTIFLNGNPTGINLPNGWAFTNWHPISISSGLVPGLNTLTFYVTNASFGSTGLRLELSATARCCSCAPQPCSCSLVNGDFGQSVPVNGTGGGWTSSGLIAGFSGWQATGGNPGGTFLLNNVGDPATDPTISQMVCCLKPGQCYTIRGQRKVQAWFGQTAPSFAVLLDGVPILILPVPTNPADANWHDFSVSFTATNTCQTISFAAEFNGTDVSYWVDNLRLECCNPNCDISIRCPRNLVLLTCNPSAVGNYIVGAFGNNPVVTCTPPSGTAFPQGTNVVTCTATNNCGAVANCYFRVIVKPPPGPWPCGWQTGIGISYEFVGGATASFSTIDGSPDDSSPTMSLLLDPATPNSGALLHPGTAQAIRFTTLLDFTAPVGAGFDLALPPDPTHPNQPPIVSLRNKGPKGYCVKTMKFYDDNPSALLRAYTVNSNGNLLDPISFTADEINAAGVFDINFQPGVDNCHVTIELDLKTGAVSVEIPGPITPSTVRKGWDGCIYGPDRPVKKPTSRVSMIPPVAPGQLPITDLYLYPVGVTEFPIEEPTITASGRKWGDGHVTLMKAYDDGESLEFAAVADGGGVKVDLGQTASFDLALTKFDTSLPLGEDLLTRTIGPIRGLTNRPPPPFLDALLLHSTSSGVECSADFSNLGSPTVQVVIFNHSLFVTTLTALPAQLDQALLVLPDWPLTLGKLGGRTPCRRITIKTGNILLPGVGGPAGGVGGAPGDAFVGDEILILAELPDDAPRPDYYSAFEFVTSDGADWGVSSLQRTLACVPTPLAFATGSDGITISWSGEGLRLQGAEDPNGPWFDLGVTSPVSLASGYRARFFRLVCE